MSHGTLEQRLDSWGNDATGYGVYGADKTMAAFIRQYGMSIREGLDIYRYDPVGARLADMIPNEATRQGIEIIIGDHSNEQSYTSPEGSIDSMLESVHPATKTRTVRGDGAVRLDANDTLSMTKRVNKRLNDLSMLKHLASTWKLGRAGGQAGLLLGAIDYTTDLSQPMDMSRVRDMPWVTPIDPMDFEPAYYYDNPFAPGFNQVAIWRYQPQIAGRGMGISAKFSGAPLYVHESRLIVFEGTRVYQNQITADSIYVRLKQDLADYHLAYRSVNLMLAEGALGIYQYAGLGDLMQKKGFGVLAEIIAQVDYGKSSSNAVLIDKNDEYKRMTTPMAGYPDVLREIGIKLSTSSGTPVPLLIGISPGGLVTSGDGETRRWYDLVSTEQENTLAPPVKRAVEICMAIEGIDPTQIAYEIKFAPLWKPSEKEIAEAEKLRSEADKNYWEMKAVSSEEITWSRFRTPKFSHSMTIDWAARKTGSPIAPSVVDMNPDQGNANDRSVGMGSSNTKDKQQL